MLLLSCSHKKIRDAGIEDTILLSDTIGYHAVRVNKADSSILPWYSSDPGVSYDTALMLVWNFWKNMETDSNGLKYYMNHQVWKPGHDMRGLGGDQINMALSSWTLLYAYTGDQSILENMKYLADTYLERSLSDSTDKWPWLPYPYNTKIHSGVYDGDMRNGKGYLQPDKAGNFGYELINLFKITGESKYLEAAKRIGNTLMSKTEAGNNERSPLPFRVHAKTGKPGYFFDNNPDNFFDNNPTGRIISEAVYTSNWTGTLMLFEELQHFDVSNKEACQKAFDIILEWMKAYPLKTNKWGPFFEDIPGWSDTQTNAISFAMFMMNNQNLFPSWKQEVKGIFDWTYRELGNDEYRKYKVRVMNEQTVYRVPGNSHSSRQASAELLYGLLSVDSAYTGNAIRTLNWATYTVADDGRNRYIRDDIWLTDGYGDYVRHYLRAMAVKPELAPANKNRLLSTSSVITAIDYQTDNISYKTYDNKSQEVLRLVSKPGRITLDGKVLNGFEDNSNEGWMWKALDQGGVVIIRHTDNNKVKIEF